MQKIKNKITIFLWHFFIPTNYYPVPSVAYFTVISTYFKYNYSLSIHIRALLICCFCLHDLTMPFLLLLHLTLSMRNLHCFVTATTNALAHLVLLVPGHLHLAISLTLATEIRSSNRLAGSAAMDTCSAIIAVTGPSSVPFAVSRWVRADVACCRINYSRCSLRISPAMEVSTGGGFAFNGQQTGASFRLLHSTVPPRCNDPNRETSY